MLAPRQAYELWSATYDAQPHNVILQREHQLFGELLSRVPLAGKTILDVGCGTGRHWERLLSQGPRALHGADTSPEMLDRLRARFSGASLHLLQGPKLDEIADASIDVLVSTLTIGHIEDIGEALAEWFRTMRPGGDMILTDFHPEAFRAGMKRTFVHGGETIEIENHAHGVESLSAIFRAHDARVVRVEEKTIDESVRVQFEREGYLAAYRRYRGTPLILGLHVRKHG